MATETEGIIIPIQIDGNLLKNDLKAGINDVNNFVSEIKKSFEGLNKQAVFKMNKQTLAKDIEDIQEQLKSLDKNKLKLSAEIETKDIRKQLDFIEEQSKRLNNKLKFRMEVQEAKGKSLRTLNKEIKDINNILKEKNKVIVDADTQTFKKTKKEIDDLEEQLKKLEETRDLKVEINKNNLSQIQASLSTMKKMALGVAAGVGAITAALVGTTKQAMDFETAFAEVRTLINDMPESGLNQLKQGLIDLSKQTGILTGESIPAMYQAISASVPADNVVSFLEVASKNAIGGVTDLQTSVDGLTNILNAYAMETSEVMNVSDLMFETMKRGKTTIGELSRSYFNVIPYAASAGVAFRDISAAMATITAQGTPTSVATTQLRQAIVELSNEGSQVGKTFQSLAGKSFKDFIASGKNLQDALQLLEKKAKASNVGINTLFSSVDAGASVLGLVGNNTQRFTADMEAMANAAGATEEAFKKIDETPAQRLKKIRAQFSAITLEIGNKLLPTAEKLIAIAEKNMPKISKTIETVGSVIVGLVKNMNILLPIVAGVGAGFLGLNIALAITAPASMGVATGIKAIAASFTLLNAQTGGLIIAIGLLATAIVALIANFETVAKWADKLLAKLGNLNSQMKVAGQQAEKSSHAMSENAKAIQSGSDALTELILTYDKLNKKTNRTAEENEKLKNTFEELAKEMPELAEAIEKNGGKIDNNIGLDKFYTEEERGQKDLANKSYLDADNAYKKAVEQRIDLEKRQAQAKEYTKKNYDKSIADALKKEAEAMELKNKAQAEMIRLSETLKKRRGGYKTSDTSTGITDTGADANVGGGNEKDPIAELKKRWKANKEFINNTIADEEKKNEALLEENKKFYSDLEKLTKDTNAKLIAEGKNKSATEKKYLQGLVKDNIWAREELEKLNKDDLHKKRLELLEKEYNANVKTIEKTIEDEEEKNATLKARYKKYLQDVITEKENQLNKLNALSQEEKEARADEIAGLENDLKDLRKKLKDAGGDGDTLGEALKKQWQNIVSHVQNAVNSIANIWSTMWSNQIDVVQDALDEELKRIEKNLEEQQKMYDKQIEATEEREAERKKIIEDTQKEIDEINEEIGEHMTEEKYKQLEEQREALEEKLQAEQEALEQDELYRQDLETQKQLREDEAQLLKEQKEREAAIKTAELKRKQAIMDKATGIFNATVALASGIAQAVAAGSVFPPVLIPLYVGLVVAAAAGQIAAIAATPLPEIPQFASGGYVPSGNENYYKGLVGTSGNNTDKTLVWASEGERVLNHAETKQWEYYQSRELKSINNNTINNKNPVVNLGGITINAGIGQDAKKLANLSGKAIAKSVVMAITRGYNN